MFTKSEYQLILLALSTLRQHSATIHALRVALAASMKDKEKALAKIAEVEEEWDQHEPERHSLDQAVMNLQIDILKILNA